MKMLSDDDLNLKALNDDELARAWDLWFDLAQSTNAGDPPYTHRPSPRLRQAGRQTADRLHGRHRRFSI